jgi:hypothetical protein
MKIVYRLLACLVTLALFGAGAALAGRGDPQEKLTAADNARARSMVLRKDDLGRDYRSYPWGLPESRSYCRAVDVSDLTLTGKALSQSFHRGFVVIVSYASIYASLADANAAWRRATSPAGEQCMREGFRRAQRSRGGRVISFGRSDPPPFAQRSIAFRLVWAKRGTRHFADIVVLQQSRAIASISFGSPSAPVPKATVTRLSRLVAARMKTAMRGA